DRSMVSLGHSLESLLVDNLFEFRALASSQFIERKTAELRKLRKKQKANRKAPKFFRQALEEHIARTEKSIESSIAFCNASLSGTMSVDDAEKTATEMIFNFSKLLQVWPDMLWAMKDFE
ncbi:hypothetical protein BVY02_02450, partial [bacterium J17]